MKASRTVKVIRVGLLRCPKNHTAYGGHTFYNQIDLKDGEGIGSKIKLECGFCFKEYSGMVEKISERCSGNESFHH